MDIASIKNKVRKLKNLEIQIRFGKDNFNGQPLFWDDFFDLTGKRRVKYPLAYLISMNNNEYRRIADEFLAFVYGSFFEHLDIPGNCCFDKEMLVWLDLPFDADIVAVKKRFRQLAKEYHPDAGGDSRKFIELVELYRKMACGNQA